MSNPLLWWECDEEAFVAIQTAVGPFFATKEFHIATEEFTASLEQLWAMSEGLA